LITSVKNPRVKEIKALQSRTKARRDAGAFVVEGIRLAEEVVAAGWNPRLCMYTPDLNPRGQALVDRLVAGGVTAEPVAEHVMKAVSDTQTPQGILLVVEQQTFPLPATLRLILILDRIQDPGNVGTLLRTAAAAGFDAVLLTEGSVDAFSPKVLRAGMGAHFRLPTATLSPAEIVDLCEKQGITLWSASVDAGQTYSKADLTAPLALVIGSEAHGVGSSLRNSSHKLHIPMPGGGESLNAATAGAVLMFEVIRQRVEFSET